MVCFYHKNQARGFSLIEILLVVVLLSIITVFAVPNFSQTYQSFLLSKTTENLADMMRYAQSRAVMSNKTVQLKFNDDFSGYQLLEFNSEEKSFVAISNRLGRLFDISKEMIVSGESAEIAFYPDGTIDLVEVSLCLSEKCYIVTSKVQRGFVTIFEKGSDEQSVF